VSGVSPADLRWLGAAARLAGPYLGTTGDQPAVGAVVVDEALQVLFGRGVTGRGGSPGGVAQALAEARGSARGRTLYATLEPDTGWRRAPPAVDAVIQAGVARVVAGIANPEPGAAGSGIARLRAAGIEALIADHPMSQVLHEGHVSRHRRERPFVAVRLAVSRDGKIGLPDRGRALALAPEAERWIQVKRSRCDAVMIGARAARLDDPDLMLRIRGLGDRTYMRIVVAGTEPLDSRMNLIAWISGYPTAIVAEQGRSFNLPPSVQMIAVAGRKGRPDLRDCLRRLAGRGIGKLLVEGGARLSESLLGGELVDRFHLIESPVEIGRRGVPATMLGELDDRLRAAGFIEVDRRPLGADKLRTFEKEM
jgi:diaminohydroxyphosphoribosylaminopyrimidine deaminase/5-amino-6-(5-phosphoribosylamino)uracil reductase